MKSYQKLSIKVTSTLVFFITAYLFGSGFSSLIKKTCISEWFEPLKWFVHGSD